MLDILEREHLTARAGELGTRLLAGLRELKARFPHILTVRGTGLMLGRVLGDPQTRQSLSRGWPPTRRGGL